MSGDAPRTTPIRVTLGGVTSVELHRAELRRVERKGSDVVLSFADPRMSTQHARLSRTGEGEWVVADLGSKNGTWVGSERIMRQPSRNVGGEGDFALSAERGSSSKLGERRKPECGRREGIRWVGDDHIWKLLHFPHGATGEVRPLGR